MKIKKDSLGDRQKRYEAVSASYLIRRMPVIIRLDGIAFHTFTKGLKKPYDELLSNVMQRTMHYLAQNIQGCSIGYTQSDEITLLLTDYETLETDAWYAYNVQKMTSASASLATKAFNKFFKEELALLILSDTHDKEKDYIEILRAKIDEACFDSRAFNVPKEDVANNFLWRQKDSTRNSIQGLGQANFKQSELNGKKLNEIQEMLFSQKGINWNNVPTKFKRGSCVIKVDGKYVIDSEIPIFSENFDYIDKYVFL